MENNEACPPSTPMEIDSVATATEAPLLNTSPNITTRSSTRVAKPSAKTKGTMEQRSPAQTHKRRWTADPATFTNSIPNAQDDMKEVLMVLSGAIVSDQNTC